MKNMFFGLLMVISLVLMSYFALAGMVANPVHNGIGGLLMFCTGLLASTQMD